jgi:hypothetical protein
MASTAFDLKFLEASVDELGQYLLSKELYWPLGLRNLKGEAPFPRMTLGWMLLSEARQQGRSDLTDDQQENLARLSAEIAQQRERWMSAWRIKALLEFESRLKLWTLYMNELKREPQAQANRYPYEIQRRVILTLLQPYTQDIEEQKLVLLSGMDRYLRGALKAGPFVWETELEAAFSDPAYWYLFGQLTG